MQSSQIPSKFNIPFASSAGGGFIRAIPQTPSGTPGQASLQNGFPPENFNPVAAGGVPPFGQDFNGIFNQISAWCQWLSAGYPIVYDATFQTAIGGYPKGAIVQSVTTFGIFYLCTAENNVTNPDTGGSGWVIFNWLAGPNIQEPAYTSFTTPGGFTFTVPANKFRVRAQIWGAGGGGGFGLSGSPGGAASGGGAGAYCNKVLDVNPGDTITGTVGAGGAAGNVSSNGLPGGTSSITYSAVTYSSTGGGGGINASGGTATNSVAGGAPTNGDLTSQIGQPSYGGLLGYSGSGILPYGGAGGQVINGGYGGQAGSGAANSGGAPGGGGGGGASGFSAGAGANGEVLFSY